MEPSVRLILNWVVVPIFLIFILYLMSVFFILYFDNSSDVAQAEIFRIKILADFKSGLETAAGRVWGFASPILQLAAILLLLVGFARAMGFKDFVSFDRQTFNVQTILSVFIIGGFTIAAFLSHDPASWLKDLALVVVGFYFGRKAKDDPDQGAAAPVVPAPGGAVAASPGAPDSPRD